MEIVRRYDLVLWDFHGTSTSNRGRLAHALNTAYQQTLRRKVTRAEFLQILHRPEDLPSTEALAMLAERSMTEEDKEKLLAEYRQLLNTVYIPKHRPVLRELHALGVTCVIVTNGTEAVVRSLVDQWGLRDCIREIYGRGSGGLLKENSIPRKPDPQVIDFVITDLGRKGIAARRDRILMVGDYTDDIGAGNSAGIHTAFLLTGPNQDVEAYPDRPTFVLLDSPTFRQSSIWARTRIGEVHLFRDLPGIVTGRL